VAWDGGEEVGGAEKTGTELDGDGDNKESLDFSNFPKFLTYYQRLTGTWQG